MTNILDRVPPIGISRHITSLNLRSTSRFPCPVALESVLKNLTRHQGGFGAQGVQDRQTMGTDNHESGPAQSCTPWVREHILQVVPPRITQPAARMGSAMAG